MKREPIEATQWDCRCPHTAVVVRRTADSEYNGVVGEVRGQSCQSPVTQSSVYVT